jgi:hypothetical protein
MMQVGLCRATGRLPGVVPEEGDLEFALVLSTGSEREL